MTYLLTGNPIPFSTWKIFATNSPPKNPSLWDISRVEREKSFFASNSQPYSYSFIQAGLSQSKTYIKGLWVEMIKSGLEFLYTNLDEV